MSPYSKRRGIRFRSREHADWFRISVSVLAGATLWYWTDTRPEYPNGPYFGFAVGWLLHSGTAILAAIATRFDGRKEDGFFSVDCIWFNGLLAAFYSAALMAASRGWF